MFDEHRIFNCTVDNKRDCMSPQMEKEALASCPILDSSFSESHQPALGTLSIRESRQFTKEHLACRERI
jgi:hypothetical protein